MAKKRAAPVREEKRTAAEYYRLNTQAVEDLVTADASNSPEVSEEELPGLLERSNLPLYATALRHDTVDIKTADLSRSAVVIGSEGKGISDELLGMSEKTLKIPMRDRCESLNAAAAATIVLWEMYR